MMIEPEYISQLGMVGQPLLYKWNDDLALHFYAAKDQNIRLYRAVDLSNFRMTMALGIIVTECVVWRFKGHTDLTDALNRIEAAWVCSLDPAYAKSLKVDRKKEHARDIAGGPVHLAMKVLGILYREYSLQSIYMAEPVVKQATLALHVVPDKKKFSAWLSALVKRSAEAFPRTEEHDEDTEVYDASDEVPIPPQFFEPGFKYSKKTGREAWNSFLQTLKPAKNPYLRSAKEMAAEGFKGTPYVF